MYPWIFLTDLGLTGSQTIRIGGIDWPEPLVDAIQNDRLVVFAGAGVSMGEPSYLPDFESLADAIASGHSRQLKRTKVQNTAGSESDVQGSNAYFYRLDEPIDGFLGELCRQGVSVQRRAARILKERNPSPNSLHVDLLRLFEEPSRIRVVTTNYDTLFEQAALTLYGGLQRAGIEDYQVKGGYLSGVYHIHGDWDDPPSIVIRDSDFARGYINPGEIRQYLLDLFRQFSVLFIGYSLSDTLMRYLSMVIDVSAMPRYVLTDDPDPDRWRMFDMVPIGYAKSPNHCALMKGVHEFADFREWSSSDWEHEIGRIAASGFPTSKEDEDLIHQALRGRTRARIFRDNATSPEWLAWLDNNGYFAGLFEHEELNWLQSTLSYWVAHSHALQHPDEVFELIAKYPGSMNPKFWGDIVQAISNSRNADIPMVVIRQWVSVLLARSPGYINEHLAIGLIETALKHDDATDGALAILDHVIEARVIDKVPYPANSRHAAFRRDEGLSWGLKTVWAELSSRIDAVAEPLTEVIVRSILRQHEIAQTWRVDNLHGPWIHGFEPIPKLNEKNPRSPGSVLIGMVANSLAWMALHRSRSSEGWVARYCNSPVEILRRLAVGTVLYLDWQPQTKIEWLIQNGFVSDRRVQIEAHALARNTYFECDVAMRERLVTSIVAGNAEPRGCTCDAPMSDDGQFDWLSKLRAVDPGCQVVDGALIPLKKLHPEWDTDAFAEREPVSTTAYRIRPAPLIPVDELLSKSISVAVDELLACASQAQEISDGDDVIRKTVARTVFEASSQEIEWGLQVARELSRRGEWRHVTWQQLLSVWDTVVLDNQQFEKAIEALHVNELIAGHSREIARILRRRFENQRHPHPPSLITEAKKLARALWDSCASEIPSSTEFGWWTEAWDAVSGNIVSFWVNALRVGPGQSVRSSGGLGCYDRDFLTDVVLDESPRGLLGKSILGQQMGTLFRVDPDWTKDALLPLFEVGNESSPAVWDGIAAEGRLTPGLADLMQPLFLQAVPRLGDRRYWSSDEVRRKFIGKFVIVMMHHVTDPIPEWIPAFFDNSNVDDRVDIAIEIREILAGASDDQRVGWWESWLKEYWQNRLEGVPAQLTSKEVGMMLQWPKNLGPRISDAVNLVLATPVETLRDGYFSSHVVDSTTAAQYPLEAASLLIFIDSAHDSVHRWYQMDEVFEAIAQSDLEDALKNEIDRVKTSRTISA